MIEVESNYTFSQALREASRCLQCFDPPCTEACPAGIVIPRFIRMIKSTNLRGAGEVVRSSNPMASSCGVACPGEQLCATACARAEIDEAIEIRRLHRFVTEEEDTVAPRRPMKAPLGESRVAIVGAGPAGLACAAELHRKGIQVTLYDARDRVGGVLSSTIPLYRFPEKVVRRDVSWILEGDRGIDLRVRTYVDDVEALAVGFDAVFVATGLVAGGAGFPGTRLKGVSTGEEFLGRCREKGYKNKIGAEIVVVGGGNVAIDAAMAGVRCGEVSSRKPRVRIFYRRTRAEMPAWKREVREAERLGVTVHFLVLTDGFGGQRGRLTGVRYRRATLGSVDRSGRPSPVPIPGSEAAMTCDQAILAIGQKLDDRPIRGLPTTDGGLLKVNPRTQKVRGKIYAGGDATSLNQTIVAAVRDGKRAADAITASLGVRRS